MKNFIKIISIFVVVLAISIFLLINNQNYVKDIDSIEINSNLNNSKYLLIDVREEDEYRNIYIKNSKNIPLSKLSKEYEKIPTDKNVVVICGLGKRSLVAYKFLKEKGYKNIYNLKGGLLDWQAQGLELIKEKNDENI